VVVALPGCRTKSRTKRLEIQPCCSALLVVVLLLVFDFLECRSLLEEAGRLGVLLLQGVCVRGLAAAGILESFFKGCSGRSLFVFGHVGCCNVVVCGIYMTRTYVQMYVPADVCIPSKCREKQQHKNPAPTAGQQQHSDTISTHF
jgi:hypothetical protein